MLIIIRDLLSGQNLRQPLHLFKGQASPFVNCIYCHIEDQVVNGDVAHSATKHAHQFHLSIYFLKSQDGLVFMYHLTNKYVCYFPTYLFVHIFLGITMSFIWHWILCYLPHFVYSCILFCMCSSSIIFRPNYHTVYLVGCGPLS